MSHFLVVDQGYFVFYRYFAIQQWFRHSHEAEEHAEMETHPDFLEMLSKRLLTSLEDLVKQHRVDWSRVIVCCDGTRSQLWRTKTLKDDYKSHRQAPSGIGHAFQVMTSHLTQLQESKGITVLKHVEMEADDIVATVHRYLRQHSSDDMITIIATDADYFQLLDEKTQLKALNKRDPTKQSLGNQQLDLTVKIIQGDTSDGIPGCFPRCGRKTAIKLANDPKLLESYFQKHEGSRELYRHNQQMIDFSSIPEHLSEVIFSQINHLSQLTSQ